MNRQEDNQASASSAKKNRFHPGAVPDSCLVSLALVAEEVCCER